MKRLVLMFLFILILLRILQQLYVRTNNGLANISGESDAGVVVTTDGGKTNEGNSACISSLAVWNNDFNTYSAGLMSKMVNLDGRYISNQSTNIDKTFFAIKRLIMSTKSVYCYLLYSIDVWKGHFASFRASLLEKIEGVFVQLYYPNVSEVIIGLTLGIDKANKGVNSHLFKVTGTQHLMAISGFNLSFFVMFVSRLYGRSFSKSMVLMCNLVSACFFVWFIGTSPGLLRAFLMFVVSHSGYLLKRQVHVLHTFFLTVLIVFLIDISIISSIGFQLSYAATLGIILFSSFSSKIGTMVESAFIGSSGVTTNFLEYIFVGLYVSFSAQLMVLPLLLYHFQEFSLVGAIATVAVSWAMPFVLQFGLLTALTQFFVPLKILFIFSLPLFLVSQSILFILKIFYFDFFLIHSPNFEIWVVVVYYISFLLIYGSFCILKENRKRIKYDKIYHFCF